MRWAIIMLFQSFIPGGPPRRKLMRDQGGTILRFQTFQQACATVRLLGKLPHHTFEVIQLNAYGRPLSRWGVWRIAGGIFVAARQRRLARPADYRKSQAQNDQAWAMQARELGGHFVIGPVQPPEVLTLELIEERRGTWSHLLR